MLTYIHDNFNYSPEAGRLICDICIWAADHYENKDGSLTEEGIHFLERTLDGIGITREDIVEHWKED